MGSDSTGIDRFPIIGEPEYYLRDLDINANPDIGETVMGNISIEIKMNQPALDEEIGQFTCDCELFIDLSAIKADDFDGEFEHYDFGSITSEMTILVEPLHWDSQEEKEEWVELVRSEIDDWEEQGYEAVSDRFQYQLESELLSDVLTPIANILKSGFRGILPRVLFERTSDESEE